MKKQHLIIILALFLLSLSINIVSVNGSQKIEKIYTPKTTKSFSYRWISTETGKQEVEELFPDDEGATNTAQSDVIRWFWEKSEAKWAGWGMQWKGWNKPIDFFSLVDQSKEKRGISSQAAKEFSEKAKFFELQFKIKGFISDLQHKKLVQVKFDGEGDKPSQMLDFLSYIRDNQGQKVELNNTKFHIVRIPLNDFRIVRSRIDAGKIKQIVFGTPTAPNTRGELYIYDIKIVGKGR